MAFRREGEEFTDSGDSKLLPLSGKAVLEKREAFQTETFMTYTIPTPNLDQKPDPTGSYPVMKTTFVREVRAVYCGPRRATTRVRGPSTAADFIRRVLPDNSREHFVVLHLDGSNQIIGYAVTATGGANFCQIHPREVFQGAILAGAVGLIVSHNHPSGDTTPSREDKDMTTRLKEGAQLLGLKLLDHVIVTDTELYSLSEEGTL
jgi:DNA repair protein RadC